MTTQIQLRRDTSANWTSVNPVLAEGEIGMDMTANAFKVGDGVSAWNDIEYAGSGGGTGAGMVISETEPADKVEGMQWLNPTNGLVLFWDDEKWLQMPGGVDGVDGTNGADGADGKGWTAGSYDASTGVVTFDSDDGLGFSTGDLRGADGKDGADGAGVDSNGDLNIGDWKIAVVGGELVFSSGGSVVAKVTAGGQIIGKDDVTAFGSI